MVIKRAGQGSRHIYGLTDGSLESGQVVLALSKTFAERGAFLFAVVKTQDQYLRMKLYRLDERSR